MSTGAVGRGSVARGASSTRGPAALVAARKAVESGVDQNATGRPVRASAAFRRALRHLAVLDGPDGPDGPDPHDRPSGSPATGSSADADAAECAYLRARALLGLVMSDFELRAEHDVAVATLDAAARWARVAGAAAVEVAVHGQRGLLELRAGAHAAAVEALDTAVRLIDGAEPLDACVLLLNRGTLHLELGHLEPALADLEECARRARTIGSTTLLVKAQHNLGYLAFLRGDLPAALASMAAAGRLEHDASPAVALLDRAQVLLEAGLLTEADAALGRAAALFRERRLGRDLAEVDLLRARCALLAGRPQAALGWAADARRRFARRGLSAWRARADLVVARARLAVLLERPEPAAAELVRVARHAEALGREVRLHPGPVADTWRAAFAVAAEAWAAAGRLGEADAALAALAGQGRDGLLLGLQIAAVRATVAFGRGDRPAGTRVVAEAQAVLADHRRRLGSVEVVTAAAVHGERLAAVDVGAALASGDPAAVLDALERARATFAGPARVRPPQDPAQAALLTELRGLVERERLAPPDATERAELGREIERLRTAARERAWQHGGGAVPRPAPSAAGLMAALAAVSPAARPTVADYVDLAGWVSVVVADGSELRLLRLAESHEVQELAHRVRVDLQAAAQAVLPSAVRQTVLGSLRRGLARLDDLLVAPLGCSGPLHVVAGGSWVTLPWAMLPSRRGRPTTVATRVRLGGAPARADGLVAIAGPGLALAEAEARAVVDAWGSGTALAGSQAHCAAARTALATAGVVHLAAHGHHEADNPLFSWVRLDDGPLFAHELDRITLPGSLVVLSACEVGRATPRPGGEVLGMAAVLLRLGAAAVVAALAPVRDEAAAAVMPLAYRALREGASPQAALADACAAAADVPLACFAAGVPGVAAH